MGPAQAIRDELSHPFRTGARTSRPTFWWLLAMLALPVLLTGLAERRLGWTWSGEWQSFLTTEAEAFSLAVLGSPVSSGLWPVLFLPPACGPLSGIAVLIVTGPLACGLIRRANDSGKPAVGTLIALPGPLLPGAVLTLSDVLISLLPSTDFGMLPGVLVIALAPFVALLLFLIVARGAIIALMAPSEPGPNRYGPNPSEVTP